MGKKSAAEFDDVLLFHPLMKRWFKNQNKTVFALENVSHTSSHVLKMANKINEKLLFPLKILQAQDTVIDFDNAFDKTYCFILVVFSGALF